MRARRRILVLVLAFVLVAGVTQPVEALEFEQKCNGPHVSAQSGRITFTPGLNGKAVRQRLDVRISLFSCSPARDTRGSGTFKSSFLTKRARGCGLLSTVTAFKVKATVDLEERDQVEPPDHVQVHGEGAQHRPDRQGQLREICRPQGFERVSLHAQHVAVPDDLQEGVPEQGQAERTRPEVGRLARHLLRRSRS